MLLAEVRVMKYLVLLFVVVLATSAFGLEKKAYQLREDFGSEPVIDCVLNYYYYIPCPTYSWFWAFSGWAPGDIVGTCFRIGDEGTGGWAPCDPATCHQLDRIRFLDFAGYGTVYYGLFDVQVDIYCCAMSQNPYLHLWQSGRIGTHFGWNYVDVNDPDGISLCPCSEYDFMYPRVIVTLTMVGTEGMYPAVGFDNISTTIEAGCDMHDIGCLTALYPRDWCGGSDPRVHSGLVGTYPFEYWPPLGFCDGGDTTPDCSQYGYVDLALRLYVLCTEPTEVQPTSWGEIKSLYD
jgi:hypothetical protein